MLRVGSIYTSESGEWRVGGFEVLSNMNDTEAIIYVSITDSWSTEYQTLNLAELWQSCTRFETIYSSGIGKFWMGFHKKTPDIRNRFLQLWNVDF